MRQPRACGTANAAPSRRRGNASTLRDRRAILILLILLTPLVLAALASLSPVGVAPGLVPVLSVASLDHPTRVRIISHLEKVPGDYFRSIVRAVQESVGETRHHLNVLMRHDRVREVRQQNLCRYYVNGDASVDRNMTFEAYWALKDNRGRVLGVVRQRHVVRPSDVASELGISRQLAAYHLQRLAESGNVHRHQGRYRG